MIRDRGRIKWTAMMLPEHVKLLRDWAQQDEWEKPKQLDEQKLEEMNEIALQAQNYHKEVSIHYFANNYYETIAGQILSVDLLTKEVKLADAAGNVHCIPLAAIENIELVNE